jgi:hypothetical protein
MKIEINTVKKTDFKVTEGSVTDRCFRQLSNLTDSRFRLLPAKTSTCVPLVAIKNALH